MIEQLKIIRVYSDESKCQLSDILEELRSNPLVTGVTVFRGIAGFGPHKHLHTTKLIDLSAQLPLVIELFHPQDGAEALIQMLHKILEDAHIVSWDIDFSS